MLLLWKTYLRPILEYASQVWNNSYHAQRLELIQRRFTKKIGGLREVPYENRLSKLELPTLSTRRLYLDLKFTHKLLQNKLNVSPRDLGVNFLVSRTRGNGISLMVNRPKTAILAKNFAFRIPKQWNSLPNSLRTCDSHNSFILRLRNKLF